MAKHAVVVTVLLVASACSGSADTTAPVVTASVATTSAATPTTTVGITTVAPTTTQAPITTADARTTTTAASTFYPASDPGNDGGWVLRSDLSDEFDSGSVDLERWFIAGDPANSEQLDDSDGSSADWVGRAPGVFDPTNAVVQDGKLQLLIEWEPSSAMFPVLDDDGDPMLDEDCDCPYENYTVGGLVSRNSLQYGYAEIRAKAAPLPVSSAFWMIGNHFEIDVFEMIGEAGDGPDGSGAGISHLMPTTIHNWDVGDLDDNGYGEEYELEWGVAEDFHTYGAEWAPAAVIFYADGQEVGRITQQEAGLIWNTEELHIWIDNEVFIWEGLPSPERLPSEFLVDYVRVWQ